MAAATAASEKEVVVPDAIQRQLDLDEAVKRRSARLQQQLMGPWQSLLWLDSTHETDEQVFLATLERVRRTFPPDAPLTCYDVTELMLRAFCTGIRQYHAALSTTLCGPIALGVPATTVEPESVDTDVLRRAQQALDKWPWRDACWDEVTQRILYRRGVLRPRH